jgi:uncharacterized low-complexity protein
MITLFHRAAVLSIGAAALGLAAASQAAAPASPYWGRWTVDDPEAVFTARGREYQTIDIAPCGKDFCGVSVAANGKCGPTLFRFLMKRAHGREELRGKGKWGRDRKNVQIWLYNPEDASEPRNMELYLGDGHNFGERSGSMPRFHGSYKPVGASKCNVS